MPKAKKTKGRPRGGQEVASIPENKVRGRTRSKQHAVSARQRSRSVDGAPLGRHPKRIRILPPSRNPVTDIEDSVQHLEPNTELSMDVPPPEGSGHSLRGRPEQVTTVSGEAFSEMGHDLKSNFQGVFQDLNNAMGQGSALTNTNFLAARKQPHRRQTRSSAHESDQFFKSLVPKDKIPDQDRNIKVEFAGTNTITTNAPGYTETISFGNGLWSRTRNGVTETGRLDEAEGARIAEQTKQTIDGIMHHTASRLTGMMGPSGWWGEAPRSRSPKRSVPPPSAVEPLRGGDGYLGNSGRSNNVGPYGSVATYGSVGAFGNIGESGKIGITGNTVGSSGVYGDSCVASGGNSNNLSGNMYDLSVGDLFTTPSTSGLQNGRNGLNMPANPSLSSKKISRPKAADLFERYEDGEYPY